MTFSPMSGRADAVSGVTGTPGLVTPAEHDSDVGPAPTMNGRRERMRHLHQSELVLGALSSAVPCARLHAKAVLHEWGLGHLAEKMELLVSEIATNAIRASEGLVRDNYPFPPTVQMWITADEKWVSVQVWDASNRMPQKREPDPEALSGRGLLLVERLSESCGAYRLEGGNGKVVWARVVSGSG
jgi:anti-sigma regulatory factor (Ser/Thr protein kinase)